MLLSHPSKISLVVLVCWSCALLMTSINAAESSVHLKKWSHHHHRRHLNDYSGSTSNEDNNDINNSDDYNYQRIYSDETDESACIEIKNNKARNGQKLILGDCTADANGWRGDNSNGLIHAELGNGNYCMQAGHAGRVKVNEFVRLYECDPNNPLQQFEFVSGGEIRPLTNSNLCLVWRGVTPNIGTDPLFFKPCDTVRDRNDWSGDPFPYDGSEDDNNNDRSACVDPAIPQFVIDDHTDIGDPLHHSGPGFVAGCGADCYTVKDNGDDPPFDPELGDTLRFAYKVVESDNFSIQALVCGVDCDGSDDSFVPQYGRTGLMIRSSLDPLAPNVYVSHSPNGQADWSYRTVDGGETTFGFDGSPDVTCLWINLERHSANEFSVSYAYEGVNECDRDSEFVDHLNLTFEVDMPESVYVGLAVSTGVAPPYCRYTEADFHHIECRGCE